MRRILPYGTAPVLAFGNRISLQVMALCSILFTEEIGRKRVMGQMAQEEKAQENLAAELLAQMASSRQSVADSVHDGGEVVGLENIHIEGTDIDFSSVRGADDAPAEDDAVRLVDDDGIDIDATDAGEAEETGFAGGDGALDEEDEEELLSDRGDSGDEYDEREEGHIPGDGAYEDDTEDDAYDTDEDEDIDEDAYDIDDEAYDTDEAPYDDPYDDGAPAPEPKKRKPGYGARKQPFSFTVKSAYGDEARTLMYVTISESRKIYRRLPDPVESEEANGEAAEL